MAGPWEKYQAKPQAEAGPWQRYGAQQSEQPSVPQATMSAAPDRGVGGWMTDAENDLREGGNRTILGKALGYMQGRGDKGYTGLESGVSPGVAEYMGSPEMGLTKVAHGVTDVATGSPWQGTKRIVGGALQAATIPASFMAPEATESILSKIPTTEKAGEMFGNVAQAAANQPVSLTRSIPEIEKMLRLGKEGGGTVPLPVRQLAGAGGVGTPKSVPLLRAMQNDLNGVTDAEKDVKPLLYPSARNFQSGLSRLSREDMGNMGGPMKGALKQLNHALYGDIHEAATAAGRGDDYANAMKTMRRAKRIEEIGGNLKKIVIPAAAGAAGLAGTERIMRAFNK